VSPRVRQFERLCLRFHAEGYDISDAIDMALAAVRALARADMEDVERRWFQAQVQSDLDALPIFEEAA
jgi:hypothetical protein